MSTTVKVSAMRSTMPDTPLLVSRILQYGTTVHGETTMTTYNSQGTVVTSYRDIGARTAALAHALEDELGITRDHRVGTMMFNCNEHIETMFATICKGAIFNPLNKNLMTDQIRHIVNHAEDEVIVVNPSLVNRLAKVLTDCPTVRAVIVTGAAPVSEIPHNLPEHIQVYSYEALLDGRSTVYDWPMMDENDAAAICYSTGTVGAPKGIAYSQRSLYLQAMSLRATDSMAVSHGERFLATVPIYHVLSWGVPFAAFMSGAPLIMPGFDLSSAMLAKVIETTSPRSAYGVPSIWTQLFFYYIDNPPKRMTLQEIFVGGSPASPSLIKHWEETFGVDVIHVWGMTETSTVTTVARPPAGASGSQRWAYRTSQGRFPASVEYRIVKHGEVMTNLDTNDGELQVRGPFVTSSYYHSPASDGEGVAHLFRGKPVDDHPELFTDDGWLRTGDVGSVSRDGFLTVQDRVRDVIRSGGEWIYSSVLENLILESEDVVECAVIGHPDRKWVERPLAVTVLRDGIAPTAETAQHIREEIQDKLPNWMLPEYWAFVSSIDHTSVFKHDKIDLKKHLSHGEFDVIKLKGPGER